MGRHSFGLRPYVSPAVRQRKARNRFIAVCMGMGGMVMLGLALLVMGSNALPSTHPNAAGFLALCLTAAGFGSIIIGILAATEA